jgi:quercetin dioxygenase-like cupin family protein
VSAFADIDGIAPRRIWEGVVARPVHAERMTMGLIELDPGASVPEHSHEPEQVGLLLSGSLTFSVAGETREIGPGGTWSIPPNVPHSVVAGAEGAVAFEVFAPTREDWHGLAQGPSRPTRWPPPA